ncbi:MAG: tRNA pseudouridine(13) synthase TruD [Candidatus Peribacteria bacterium]|nr:MAG: tRNA pseudouridine(13) synthase TruD [Candidatus Peribacteria bacterium]
MSFRFKQTSFDFYVSENLPFKLSGKGDAFYVYFEKRNMTTHEVITFLHNRFGLSRQSIGIAGLKDKKQLLDSGSVSMTEHCKSWEEREHLSPDSLKKYAF